MFIEFTNAADGNRIAVNLEKVCSITGSEDGSQTKFWTEGNDDFESWLIDMPHEKVMGSLRELGLVVVL